ADAGGHRVEDAGRPIVLGASMELPPGSYVLTAAAPGRYPTRLPLLLDHGDAQAIEIPLPAVADVPPGFVFIPAGVSRLGSAEVDGVRRALLAEPEHPATVEAFFMEKLEVTFGEYLAFLAEIPAAERALRRPRAPGIDLAYDAEGVPTLAL